MEVGTSRAVLTLPILRMILLYHLTDGSSADEAAAVRKDAGRLTDVLRELLVVQPNPMLIDRSSRLFDAIICKQFECFSYSTAVNKRR